MPLDVGQLVRVRGQQWVVSDVSSSSLPIDELAAVTLPGSTLATLTSVSEEALDHMRQDLLESARKTDSHTAKPQRGSD